MSMASKQTCTQFVRYINHLWEYVEVMYCIVDVVLLSNFGDYYPETTLNQIFNHAPLTQAQQ